MQKAKMNNPRAVGLYSFQEIKPDSGFAFRMVGFCPEHSRKDLEKQTVFTSRVVKLYKNGNFKTVNTHYFVTKENNNGRNN